MKTAFLFSLVIGFATTSLASRGGSVNCASKNSNSLFAKTGFQRVADLKHKAPSEKLNVDSHINQGRRN